MKKMLILFLMVFNTILPAEELKLSFIDEVDKAYNDYVFVDEYKAPNFHLSVVSGYVNDELGFGVMFYLNSSKEYSLVIESQLSSYTLTSDNQGNINAPFVKTKSDYLIKVLDETGVERRVIPIVKMTHEEFTTNYGVNILKGKNEGIVAISLKKNKSFVDYVKWVSFALIIVSTIIIVVFYILKKGVFSKNNQTKETIILRPNYAKDDSSQNKQEFVQPNKHLEVESIANEVKDRDLEGILLSHGIVNDYSILNEEQKNNIMLKLMYLRDTSVISETEYKKEVINLWRK